MHQTRVRSAGSLTILILSAVFGATALTAADFKLSFGPITLPHELARLVLAEQLYRAFTILNKHPYHCGH